MLKSEFYSKVAQTAGYMKKDVADFFTALEKVLVDVVSAEDSVKLFNGFSVSGVHEDEKTRRNPRTGESVVVPEHTKVRVKIGQSFKDKIGA